VAEGIAPERGPLSPLATSAPAPAHGRPLHPVLAVPVTGPGFPAAVPISRPIFGAGPVRLDEFPFPASRRSPAYLTVVPRRRPRVLPPLLSDSNLLSWLAPMLGEMAAVDSYPAAASYHSDACLPDLAFDLERGGILALPGVPVWLWPAGPRSVAAPGLTRFSGALRAHPARFFRWPVVAPAQTSLRAAAAPGWLAVPPPGADTLPRSGPAAVRNQQVKPPAAMAPAAAAAGHGTVFPMPGPPAFTGAPALEPPGGPRLGFSNRPEPRIRKQGRG
jgi:hypothetical protein